MITKLFLKVVIALCFFVLCAYASQAISSEVVGDINGDGRVGLTEAIYALQVASGIKQHAGSQYSATGTYTYGSTSSTLILNFTSSNFPEDDGPHIGIEEFQVISINSTTMIWLDNDEDEMTWTRDNGVSGNINGTWEFYESESKNTHWATFEFSGAFSVTGEIVNFKETFSVPHKTILIDGDFNDWKEGDRVYLDTNGPDCGNVPGRDIMEVYIAQDNNFIYLRFVLNGPLDESFGYKFGNWLHIYVNNQGIVYATPIGCSVTLPDSFVSIVGNQFECKFDKCTVNIWNVKDMAAWCDQGKETVCRDYIELPILDFDFSMCND